MSYFDLNNVTANLTKQQVIDCVIKAVEAAHTGYKVSSVGFNVSSSYGGYGRDDGPYDISGAVVSVTKITSQGGFR